MRRKSFSVNQIKVGDKIVLPGDQPIYGHGIDEPFVVTGKRKGLGGLTFQLSKVAGAKYYWGYPDKEWWYATRLSSHYAQVFRGDKRIGSVTTKYW